ncbi:hypothetical protein ECP030230813_4953 [Escherichia coli P0302308.13]|nr:hypothetical protein ECP030230813_4953 [Escherichia coli P0302308.13]
MDANCHADHLGIHGISRSGTGGCFNTDAVRLKAMFCPDVVQLACVAI